MPQLKPVLLVVVAHPDDESLWIGSTLHRLVASYDIQILCMTNQMNQGRATEFKQACCLIGAAGFIFDHPDGGGVPIPGVGTDLSAHVSANNLTGRIAAVVTHSSSGEEHGHTQHIEVHRQVTAWADANGVTVAFFTSDPALEKGDSQSGGRALWFLRCLDPRMIFRKIRKGMAESGLRNHQLVRIPVDSAFKRQLLRVYEGQKITEYRAYSASEEFMLTDRPELLQP